MTFKAILEGCIRQDAEKWVRDLLTAEGTHIRRIEAESVDFIGKNDQVRCHVEMWLGICDQAGVDILFILDSHGIKRARIDDSVTKRTIWLDDVADRCLYAHIEHFEPTTRIVLF